MEESGSTLAVVVFVIFGLFVLVSIRSAVKIVPEGVNLVIERLGRYQRTLGPGLHILVPAVDRVRAGVEMREQVVRFPPVPALPTADGDPVTVTTEVAFRIIEPRAAVYEIANYATGMEQVLGAAVRDAVAGLATTVALFESREIEGSALTALRKASAGWGIQIGRVDVVSVERS